MIIMGVMIASFLLLFIVVETMGVPLLTDPTPWMGRGGVLAASLGVGLLVADVLLPVPSSLVMVAHGALFGVALGTLLSLTGSVGAALFGFAIGRRGGRLLAETVAIMAGTSSLGWGRVALASLAGSLPPALLYAITGASVANLQNTALVFVLVILLAGAFWVFGHWAEPRLMRRERRTL
jgi:uncharacterized membrane protein YdjX (TVP38/TMEM64 family)